jgi:hypothetical protein
MGLVVRGFRGDSPRKNNGRLLHPFFVVFWHMVFVDGFLILFNELGLLTNPGQ